jgi:pimeloyl-ACP methyl ester carboxylesterase
VKTLVLADTYAGWKGSLPEHEVGARVAGVERMLSAPSERLHPSFPGLFAGEAPRDIKELLDAVAADVRPESLRVALGAIAEADLRDVLPRIEVPTLLVWGELDVRSPLRVAREFARAIPHSELVVIPGAGHMSNLERPDEFNAAVRDFCRRSP